MSDNTSVGENTEQQELLLHCWGMYVTVKTTLK